MALIQIPAYNADQYPTAAVNPEHVVAVYTAKSGPPGTVIELTVRDPKRNPYYRDAEVRDIRSPNALPAVLALLAPFVAAPFVPVELVEITPHSPTDLHVNSSAIVAVQPLATGKGRGWLTNGKELYVTPAALGVLGALLVAPPAAVAAGKI
jgi:hypothetical protein